jgi:hypothetical protein
MWLIDTRSNFGEVGMFWRLKLMMLLIVIGFGVYAWRAYAPVWLGQVQKEIPVQSLAGPAKAAAREIEAQAATVHQIGPVDVDRIRQMAHDLDPSVRIHALTQCGTLAGSKEASAAITLAESCLKDSDPAVRKKAIDTLEQLGVDDAKRLATSAVQRYAGEISRKASQIIGEH